MDQEFSNIEEDDDDYVVMPPEEEYEQPAKVNCRPSPKDYVPVEHRVRVLERNVKILSVVTIMGIGGVLAMVGNLMKNLGSVMENFNSKANQANQMMEQLAQVASQMQQSQPSQPHQTQPGFDPGPQDVPPVIQEAVKSVGQVDLKDSEPTP